MANKYVRAGAGGSATGADWTNAYTSLPATLTRGDTYYVADGTYDGYTCDDAASGTTVTTIKKATASDHGTETGWNSSYGDGEAVFTGGIHFDTPYWVIDGNGSNFTSWGFKVEFGATAGSYGTNVNDAPAEHITLRSIHYQSVSLNASIGIRLINGGTDFTIENCRVSGSGNDAVVLTGMSGVTFDHLWIDTRGTNGVDPEIHGDGFVSNCSPPTSGSTKNILRYSRMDWDGQVFWFAPTGTEFEVHAWDIHGNTFYNSAGSPSASNSGLKSKDTLTTIGPLKVYNNNFEGLNKAIELNSITTGEFKNNIFYNMVTTGASAIAGGNMTHDYNYFHTALGSTYSESNPQTGGDPFLDRVNGDYSLASATNAGTTLVGYSTDPNGVTRGADGTWDRGAFEYEAGGEPPASDHGGHPLFFSGVF